MKLSKLLYAALACVLMMLTNQSLVMGDVLFAVEVDPPTAAGDTTNVTVSASSTVAGGETLSGFNIPIDLNGNGNDDAGGIFSDVQGASLVGGSISLNDAALQNNLSSSDYIVNLSNGSGFLITTDTDLFNLTLTTDSALGVGSYAVDIVTGGLFNVTALGGADLTASSSVFTLPDGTTQGSVNIVASVPEPSSLALLIGVVGMVSLKRRRS